jgi:phosphatidylserine/phosphatidylglycerophosphate/cardiolipin synthase-like enzyme
VLGAAAAGGAATLFLARNSFPTEKKIHHEIITNYAVGDDVFVRTMGNLLGPPLLKGNKVTALENGDQIFPVLLEAIRSAQRTITFENFLFREGEVSDAFAEALAERARAGVKVHFLQDALGLQLPSWARVSHTARASGIRSLPARLRVDPQPYRLTNCKPPLARRSPGSAGRRRLRCMSV